MGKYLKDFRSGDRKLIRVDYDVDITGWTFWFTMRRSFDDPISHQVKTTPGDHPSDDPAAGIVHFEIDSAASKLLSPGPYVWDIQVSKGGTPPDVITLLPPIEDINDKITVFQGVTQEDI